MKNLGPVFQVFWLMTKCIRLFVLIAGQNGTGTKKTPAPRGSGSGRGGGWGKDTYALYRLQAGETVRDLDKGPQERVELPRVTGGCTNNASHKKDLWYLSLKGEGLVAVHPECRQCPQGGRGAIEPPAAAFGEDGAFAGVGITKAISHMTASTRKKGGKVRERAEVVVEARSWFAPV